MTARRGQAMVYIAVMLPVMLLFVGFAVDVELLFSAQNRVDQAAEAAALAGAAQIDPSASSTGTSVLPPIPPAYGGLSDSVDNAVAVALGLQYGHQAKVTECPGSPAVTVAPCAPPTRAGQVYYFLVQLPTEVELYVWTSTSNPFAGLSLGPSVEVFKASAVANPVGS